VVKVYIAMKRKLPSATKMRRPPPVTRGVIGRASLSEKKRISTLYGWHAVEIVLNPARDSFEWG